MDKEKVLLAAILAVGVAGLVGQWRSRRKAEELASQAEDRYYRFTGATSGRNA